MLFFDGFGGLLLFGLWIFCIIDVITTPEQQCRNLPKVIWLLIVILLVDLGSVLWLIAGHNWSATPGQRRLGAGALRGGAGPDAQPQTGGKATGGGRGTSGRGTKPASNPDDDEEFLAGLQARVEEQRRRARDNNPDGPSAEAP